MLLLRGGFTVEDDSGDSWRSDGEEQAITKKNPKQTVKNPLGELA